ncbi:MAG: hypothetical protein F6K39_14010 [Okeania sp. SIO3B3]|nr:hypothetical protein [Okeania sp. SIO3B3]
MQRPYSLPYSSAQKNVEKFLINGITGKAVERIVAQFFCPCLLNNVSILGN